MKYTFHIVDVFSSTSFGGNQLAVLPDAAGISTEGMQKIAREFNFGETTFVLPKKDPAKHVSGAHLHTSDGARRRGASLGRHSLWACDETACRAW
jgi:predicted PhzF superfamily epimerase YddE/YHI9